MKSEGAIRHKLKNVIFYHLKKVIKKKMVQKSWNCIHGMDKPSHFDVGGETVDCHGCNLLGGACDDNIKSMPSRARQCPHFESKFDPDVIKAEFQAELETLDAGELAYRYPDVFALMWVLDMDEAGDMASSVEAIDLVEVTPSDPLEPLIQTLNGVQDAMATLNDTLNTSPPPAVANDPELKKQVKELADRLGGLEKSVPTLSAKGFWANLFGLK